MIKQKYIEALILISPNWQVEFHVHRDVSLLAMGVMLSQNVLKKSDQPIVYAFRLLNTTKRNYNTTQKEALAMVYFWHKFRHYMLGNKFVFYVDHMALVYLVSKPHVSGIIARWSLLFLKYDFIIVYKPGRTHVVTNALSNIIKPIGVLDQTIDAICFYMGPEWLNDVNEFLKTR